MLKFIVRRVAWTIPVILLVILMTFVMMRMIKGNPFRTSERRWRGAVVRALAGAADGLDAASLAKVVDADAAGRADGWFEGLLSRLEGEGLIARGADGRLRLPG